MNLKVDSFINKLAQYSAILGGVVLLGMIILTCISIIGRAFVFIGLGPVPGDFELVEAASAFAVFTFLPWCQLNRGHASVDIFTSFLPDSINRWINLIAEILLGVAMIIITWKLLDGTISKSKYGETTFIIQFPIWWAYAASFLASIVACIIAIYMIFVRINELIKGASENKLTSGEQH